MMSADNKRHVLITQINKDYFTGDCLVQAVIMSIWDSYIYFIVSHQTFLLETVNYSVNYTQSDLLQTIDLLQTKSNNKLLLGSSARLFSVPSLCGWTE